jgi:TolA-binding protein
MNSPQDRIIKKMIDNIVETNKPVFERPAASTEGSSPAHPAASQFSAGNTSTEDYSLLSRKIEYGVNSLRTDLAEMRKAIDEVNGAVKMLRNDMDGIRMNLQQARREGPQPMRDTSQPMGHVQPSQPVSHSQGAPQYRKTAADEEYEKSSGQAAHAEEAPQARGFAKKDQGADIDISKVFYYGKK